MKRPGKSFLPKLSSHGITGLVVSELKRPVCLTAAGVRLSSGGVAEVLPCGDLLVVVLRWGLQDVDSHGVAGVVGKAEDLWAHQGVLNEGQLWTDGDSDDGGRGQWLSDSGTFCLAGSCKQQKPSVADVSHPRVHLPVDADPNL